MTRELRDLEMKLAAAEQRARMAIAEAKVEEAEKAMEEVRALRKQIAMLQELDTEERRQAAGLTVKDAADLEAEYRRVFLAAIRRKRLSVDDLSVANEYRKMVFAVMHEGGVTGDTEGDVSLIVPQDVQTRINTITRQLNDLSEYVRVEQVSTLSGTRVLEKDEDMTPLVEVSEYGQIQAINNPRFVPVTYQLVKRAGFLPLTDELLADSDQNILNYVTNWIAKKVVVTRNTLIVALLNTLTATVFADLDAIKRVLNVDLDPAISLSAVIITNQDGFHWLDTQKDAQGRYLLADDITQPGRKLLFGRPVVPVANRYLPSREDGTAGKTYAPIYIGNGKEFAVWFTRGTYELASTKEGGEAWRRDSLELRVITRDDCKQWDAAAMVKGELDVTPAV